MENKVSCILHLVHLSLIEIQTNNGTDCIDPPVVVNPTTIRSRPRRLLLKRRKARDIIHNARDIIHNATNNRNHMTKPVT